MTTTGVTWPTRDEYDIAIARWTETIWDADIRSGTLAYDNMGICRFGGANLYVSIYKIGNWMVRCFCSKPPNSAPADIRDRYIAIDRFCRVHANRVSALLPVIYIDQGITVGARTLPIVKMPFLVGCPSLGEFIMDNYQDRSLMERLSDAWLRMIRELETVSMAHGDLDLSNVLVEQQNANVILRLIDYDNTWIPELAGRNQTEYGHANFQHPSFMPPRQRPYHTEMDRFSALVIYISLKTLVSHPKLYDDWGADESDRLLLSEQDYQNAGLFGSRIMQLHNLSSADMHPYIDELNASLREGRMPHSLGDIAYLTQFATRPLTPQPVQTPIFVSASAPIARWKDAVYSSNTAFPSPSQPPSTSSWNGRVGTGMPSSTPSWQPQGVYRQASEDMEKVAMPAWRPQSPTSTPYWSYGTSDPQTSLPVYSWKASASGPQLPLPSQSWNPGARGLQNSLSNWGTPTHASASAPINNSTAIASPGESVGSPGKPRAFIFFTICLLAFIILSASIALVFILLNSQHTGTITLPVGTLRVLTYSISVNPMTAMQTLQK